MSHEFLWRVPPEAIVPLEFGGGVRLPACDKPSRLLVSTERALLCQLVSESDMVGT